MYMCGPRRELIDEAVLRPGRLEVWVRVRVRVRVGVRLGLGLGLGLGLDASGPTRGSRIPMAPHAEPTPKLTTIASSVAAAGSSPE